MYKTQRCYDQSMDKLNKTANVEYPEAVSMNNMGVMPSMMPTSMCEPIYECPQERVCHKEFVHEVPHFCPINTRIVNHHIYRHTYTPCYTCCEENEVCNVYDGCCNKF